MDGMLVVETVAKIRRLHLAEGRSIKAICRELVIGPHWVVRGEC